MFGFIRHWAESIGIIDPIDDIRTESQRVRDDAMTVNRRARTVIHKSQNRRTVLQLEYDLARRRHSK